MSIDTLLNVQQEHLLKLQNKVPAAAYAFRI